MHGTTNSKNQNCARHCPSRSVTTTDHIGTISLLPLLSLSHHFTHFYYSLLEIKSGGIECVVIDWFSYRVPWRLVI